MAAQAFSRRQASHPGRRYPSMAYPSGRHAQGRAPSSSGRTMLKRWLPPGDQRVRRSPYLTAEVSDTDLDQAQPPIRVNGKVSDPAA